MMSSSRVSASPALMHVADVERAVRFLQEAFDLGVVDSFGADGDLGEDSFAMLENKAGSVQVLVVPKSTDLPGGMETPTLTLATGSVRHTASSAVRAGARLLCSHRMPLSVETPLLGRRQQSRRISETNSSSAAGDSATERGRTEPSAARRNPDPAENNGSESGMAWLEGPFFNGERGDGAVRVVLIDERLLAGGRDEGGRARRPGTEDVDGGDAIGGAAGGCEGLSSSQSSHASVVRKSSPLGEKAAAVEAAAAAAAAAAVAPSDGFASPPLLAGLASLGQNSRRQRFFSCTSVLGDDDDGEDSAGVDLAETSRTEDEDQYGNGTGSATAYNGSSSGGGGGGGGGGWFSEDDLLRGGGGVTGAGAAGAADDDGSLRGGSGSCRRQHLEYGSGVSLRGRDATDKQGGGARDGRNGSRAAAAEKSGSAPTRAAANGGAAESGAAVAEGESEEERAPTGASERSFASGGIERPTAAEEQQESRQGVQEMKPRRGTGSGPRPQRPFRQLSASMLGNKAGPLKAAPNSIAPIPIDNDHFEGAALLMIRREPMDKSYAHMFEGKNRMFEVQVQGRFKKPPEGELFISLEITERMKLGLLTRGLCKLLLSFGQKLNRRLHYSFGDKDNAELPHISFPLLTSVDSLICTPEGQEVPTLGKSFEEDKDRKASRRRGEEDNASGIGDFQTGFTYSFSFHSMYIDMAQWSTCKIPVMRDIDLHTFWGNAALRVAAYVMKPSSSPASSKLHLQSKLEYVFCVQVRHVPQSELGHSADEEDWDEAEAGGEEEEEEEAGSPAEEPGSTVVIDGPDGGADIGDEIALPLLTDRDPSPRGRHMSASRWASNDDASDGEMEDRRARRERRRELKGAGAAGAAGAGASSAAGGDGAGFLRQDNDDDEGSGDEDDSEDDLSRSSRSSGGGGGGGGSNNDRGSAPGPAVAQDALGVRGGQQEAGSRDNSRDGSQQLQQRSRSGGGGGLIHATGAPAGADSRYRVGDHRKGSTWTGAAGSGGSAPDGGAIAAGGVWEAGGQQEDAEEAMVRCPAYVDLYARSPKLKGTWTVFCVVKRGEGGGGEFALRSSKNLSILPKSVVPTSMEHSPRLSRQEVKRRKMDAVLQLLTAPSRAHANRAHQVVVRAVLGMESSADRAYRSYNPVAAATATAPATSDADGGAASPPGFPIGVGDPNGMDTSGKFEERARSPDASVSSAVGGKEQPATPPLYSPSQSSVKSGGGSQSEGSSSNTAGRGGGTGRRRSWTTRSSLAIKEGMVLRVLSEHHLSQQVAVLLPSSLTFSRPRKQCLRLLTRDIMAVELGGSPVDGSGSTPPPHSSQLIPGMYLVEIHTIGRVHYMLVEGLQEARDWAVDIQSQLDQQQADGGRASASPQDDLSISDPFSQYMTKKSSWKATNFWVLNCRRLLELNWAACGGGRGAAADVGWGGGCWMDKGGVGGQVCDFVSGLLRQALDLNDDSKTEQLITFLDDICRLRWMPLEGLSHSEQLAVFLNLYHVMLLHAFFILGPPGSPLRVASYFTTLCYEVGGDVVSMADLEHCVMRAKTSQPNQFLSKLIIPTTEYPFSLRRAEPRVSFALNCGSVSGVPGILIYRPGDVHQQLEDASAYYVQTTTEVLFGKRTVVLPKIVYWYSDDFNNKDEDPGSAAASDAAATAGSSSPSSPSLGCLLHVKRYLTGEKRRQVEALLSDGGSVTVRFGGWNWKCRPVTLVADSELESLRSSIP